MQAVGFSDLMDDGESLEVIADVSFLATAEGGKSRPVRASYRPNHNFGDPEGLQFYVGQLEVAPGDEIAPGETRRLHIRFVSGPGLKSWLEIGREWRIQEGRVLVARARIVDVVGAR